MKTPRLFFLGAPRFEIAKKQIELPAAKAIALLAYLAVHHEPQSRERILGLLWADSTEDAARKNLRNTLWSVRKALGADVLSASDDQIALSDSVWVDVREFEKTRDSHDPVPKSQIENLKSKIALYRAPLLDGFSLPGASDFEIWLTTERERLAQRALRLLDALAKTQRANGDWQSVIATARRALALDPLQEPMHRALMEAHARLGERAEALRQYDTLRETLDRELGVQPLPESDELRAAIVNGTVAATPAAQEQIEQPQAFAPSRAKGSPLPTRAPFIGREMERAALDEEFAAAKQGHARIALVVGELGIGKSRLWKEWSGALAEGLKLEARCLQSAQTLPLAPIIELFRNRKVTQQLAEASSGIAPIWRDEVARLIPEIRIAAKTQPTTSTLPVAEERHRLFEALTQCLLAFGATPVVIFVDDAHWADAATLDWLDYLVHRFENHPLLLVVAYRNEDAPTALARLIAGWGRAGLTRRILLERLRLDQSAALVESLGGDPGLATRALTQSAGNPYFLIELLRAPSGDIPAALNDLVRARLDALPDAARQVAQAAAVIEPDFDFAALRRTSGRDEEETILALDTLLRANVLVERNSHYDFAHPLVAAIVHDGLSGARHAFLHRRAGEMLETAAAGRLAPIAARLAEHFAHAGDSPRAARYADLAAEHALTLASPNAATDFYRRAIELEPTPARQMGLGRALLRASELSDAQQAFRAALSGFEATGDRPGAARACLELAETYFPAGRFDEGAQWMQQALGYLGDVADPESHALAHLLLGSSGFNRGELSDESEKQVREAVRIAAENGLPHIGGRAHFTLGNLLAQRGNFADALQSYHESITQAQVAGDDYQQVLGYNNLAYHALRAGDLATARQSAKQGLALAEARALRLPLQYLYSTHGEIALAEKNWTQAEEWFQRGLAESQAHDNREQAANYRANLALAARGRGDLDSALVFLEEAQRQAAGLTAPHLQTQIDLWLAELYLERGERTAANEALGRAEARLKDGTRRELIEWAQRLRRQ